MPRSPMLWALLVLTLISCKDAGSGSAEPPPRGVVENSQVDPKFRLDLEFIAKPRPNGSAHWQNTQNYCAKSLSDAGFQVERQAFEGGVNVLGRRPGTRLPNELVLIGAHYDSVAACPGADDNASGVAGVLHAARALGSRSFDRTLILACWDEEEVGFRGSQAFVTKLSEAERVVAYYNFEMIGFASNAANSQRLPPGFELLFPAQIAAVQSNHMRGDFIVLAADAASKDAARRFATHATRLGLPHQVLDIPEALKTSSLLADLRRSDHSSFWDADLPAIMLTDTADFRNPNYHCTSGSDTLETLNLSFALNVTEATIAAATDMLASGQ